ncbi:hypothetical protein D3C85_1860230 [compost metagenome]
MYGARPLSNRYSAPARPVSLVRLSLISVPSGRPSSAMRFSSEVWTQSWRRPREKRHLSISTRSCRYTPVCSRRRR